MKNLIIPIAALAILGGSVSLAEHQNLEKSYAPVESQAEFVVKGFARGTLSSPIVTVFLRIKSTRGRRRPKIH